MAGGTKRAGEGDGDPESANKRSRDDGGTAGHGTK